MIRRHDKLFFPGNETVLVKKPFVNFPFEPIHLDRGIKINLKLWKLVLYK